MVVVFVTSSDIEASVVMALLDSHGIEVIRASGNTQGIWPMTVSALGEIKVGVADAAADEARRIIDSHRQDVGSRVVRLRDEFDELQTRIDYRFRDRGLLEHALTHKSRAAEDASGGVADNESLEFLGDAVLGLSWPTRSSIGTRRMTKARSPRSRPPSSRRRRSRGMLRFFGSGST